VVHVSVAVLLISVAVLLILSSTAVPYHSHTQGPDPSGFTGVVAGRLLFAEALQQGTMSGFFKLIEQYR
jgi:hypothetical protein